MKRETKLQLLKQRQKISFKCNETVSITPLHFHRAIFLVFYFVMKKTLATTRWSEFMFIWWEVVSVITAHKQKKCF